MIKKILNKNPLFFVKENLQNLIKGIYKTPQRTLYLMVKDWFLPSFDQEQGKAVYLRHF